MEKRVYENRNGRMRENGKKESVRETEIRGEMRESRREPKRVERGLKIEE